LAYVDLRWYIGLVEFYIFFRLLQPEKRMSEQPRKAAGT
jgi:hypothetical protein